MAAIDTAEELRTRYIQYEEELISYNKNKKILTNLS